MDYEQKREGLNKIFNKHDITWFWDAYNFLTVKGGYEPESALAECIFYFGDDKMFDNVVSVYGEIIHGDNQRYNLYLNRNPNFHSNLKNLVKYCHENNLNFTKFGIDIDEVAVKNIPLDIFKYIVLKYKEVFGSKFPEIKVVKPHFGVQGGMTRDRRQEILDKEILDIMVREPTRGNKYGDR